MAKDLSDKVVFLYAEDGEAACLVCKDKITDGAKTNCGHVFCTTCIVTSLAFQHELALECPICKLNISKFIQNPACFNNRIKEYNDLLKKQFKTNVIVSVLCIIFILLIFVIIMLIVYGYM